MKKHWSGFFSGALTTLVLVGLVGTAFSAARQQQATLNFSGIKITLNGSQITPPDASGKAVEPFTIDGTTYLPVRGIANALGVGVTWDQSTQTVQLTSPGAPPSTPATGGYSRTNPAPVGTIQSIDIDNYSAKYNASAVILETTRGNDAWKLIQAANPFNSLPPDGQEYIIAKICISLNSITDDKSVSFSDYSFTPYSKDNVEYKRVSVVEPAPSLSGSAYAGGTTEGYAVYCVDKTDTAPKLVFGAKYDGTGGIWFSLTK